LKKQITFITLGKRKQDVCGYQNLPSLSMANCAFR
jgi:hypothetical protein